MAGKRLTCPMCKDSAFLTLEQIEEAGGRVQCPNHRVGVEMVDLAMLMEILGAAGKVIIINEDVDFHKEDMNVPHYDDFELSSS